ncbi:hypothetical protein EI94DRAFT_1804502 [Lactarius quietus]|nr:hypothetical protein EI94DRAFT_1804502 [Lactarius quietus]
MACANNAEVLEELLGVYECIQALACELPIKPLADLNWFVAEVTLKSVVTPTNALSPKCHTLTTFGILGLRLTTSSFVNPKTAIRASWHPLSPLLGHVPHIPEPPTFTYASCFHQSSPSFRDLFDSLSPTFYPSLTMPAFDVVYS